MNVFVAWRKFVVVGCVIARCFYDLGRMSTDGSPVVQLSGRGFVIGCLIVACGLLALGRVTVLPVSLLAAESGETARGALSALGPFLYGDELRERVGEMVEARGDGALGELFESELRKTRMSPG